MASSAQLTLQAATAITAATTNGVKQSLEPKSSDFIGWLHVSVCHADTTVAAKVQHSPDGTNWTDVISFTNIAGTTGFEPKAITVALLPYVRSVVTLSGTTKSATVKVELYYEPKR
jgi:hypothetical protein